MYAIIFRQMTSDQGTEGIISIPLVGFTSFCIELPWKENQRNVSCIPSGDYKAIAVQSPRFGHVYLLQDVPNRGGILIHSGNFAGDESLGFKTHSRGCILPGKMRGEIRSQKAVLYSRPTLYNMMKATEGKDLKFIIRGVV